jgi:pimeloyl-ACP methyl ester carboxylesterase
MGMGGDIRHRDVFTGEVRLRVAEAGPPDGPPVLLLHGFPEPWSGWRHQLGPLAEAGFRVLAPDQRGYGASEKPPGVAAYALDRLVADVVALADAAGAGPVALVGHDWGGIVAWWTAVRHPGRVARLVVLNAPHPTAYRRFVRRHPGQLARSAYAIGFQLPGLPEWALGRGDFRALARTLRRTSRPGTFPDALLDDYRRAWSAPGAMTAMLHWYRAGLRHVPDLSRDPRVRVPTTLIWGARDGFLRRELAPASLAYCDDGRLEVLEDATHWLHHEEPERVNALIRDALTAAPGPGSRNGTPPA